MALELYNMKFSIASKKPAIFSECRLQVEKGKIQNIAVLQWCYRLIGQILQQENKKNFIRSIIYFLKNFFFWCRIMPSN